MTNKKTYRPASGTLSLRKDGHVRNPESGATILPKTKVCSRCKNEKPVSDFLKNDKYSSGYVSWCRPCKSSTSNNKFKVISEWYHLILNAAPPAENKICRGCGELKKLSEYGKEKRGKHGVKSKCRPCDNLRNYTYRKQNTDKVYKWDRNYREKHALVRSIFRQLNYLSKIEYYRAYRKEYDNHNRDKIKAWNSKYRKANMDRLRVKDLIRSRESRRSLSDAYIKHTFIHRLKLKSHFLIWLLLCNGFRN